MVVLGMLIGMTPLLFLVVWVAGSGKLRCVPTSRPAAQALPPRSPRPPRRRGYGAGDREPRHPRPIVGSGAVALEPPDEEHLAEAG